MTPSVYRRPRRRALIAAAMLLPAWLWPAEARAFDLDRLMDCLAHESRFAVAYRQERRTPSVDRALTSHGRMIYEPPDRLILRQAAPKRQRAVVEGDRMTIFEPDEVVTVLLSQRPGILSMFDGIRGLLAGDGAAVREAFQTQLDGGAADWRLRLVPRAASARERLSSLEVAGGDCRVRRFDVQLADGGRRTIHLRPDEDGG